MTQHDDPHAAQPSTSAPVEPSGAAADSEAADTWGAQTRSDRVAQAVRTWQRQLVDLGGRNTLLWYRDLAAGTLDLTTSHPGGLAMLLAGRPTRLSDLVREPAALDEARRRARAIRAKTLELSDERGISAGFLAIGMATWTVRGASRAPAAPVLLRTCVLRPTGPAGDDFDLDLGPDVELNPVLEHYLRSEQGIEPDVAALEALATTDGAVDPYPVYAALEDLCADVPDFSVTPRLVISTFSYGKLPMVADLAAQGSSLADHDVVAALAGHHDLPGLANRDLDWGGEADPDPAGEMLVLDADTSQQAAVDAVRAGSHLVIQGAPGTGKSQTIANLVAALVGDGKRVLVVAQKRAAIESMLERLDRVGLRDLVLDAAEGAANRRRLLADLAAALDAARGTSAGAGARPEEPDTAELDRTLLELRTTLTDHARALHEVRAPWGVTAYEVQQEIASLGSVPRPPRSRVRLRGDDLARLDRGTVAELGRALTEAASLGAWAAEGGPDPWYGARVTSDEDAARAGEITAKYSHGGLEELEKTLREVFAEVNLPEASRVSDWSSVLDTVAKVRDTLEIFRPEVFDIPLGDLVAATGDREYRRANGVALGWFDRWRLRRQTRSLLRPGPPPPSLHAALLDAQKQRVSWQQMAGAGGRPEIPVDLDKARDAYDSVAADLAWLGLRLGGTAAGGELLHAPMDELQRRMDALADRADRLAVLPRVTGALDALRAAGMGALVDDLARRGVATADVAAELEFVWWTSLSEDLAARDPRYGGHDGPALQRTLREYVQADHDHLRAVAERVRLAAGRRLHETVGRHRDQAALVRSEAAKAGGQRQLRELVPLAAPVLTAAKPVWAMSPLAVASVVPPGRWFDVVVFDEASQVGPAQAVSAIARAKQVVIVGDERQLPPTGFTTSALDEDGSAEQDSSAEGVEPSVLELLVGALPTRRLSTHYRSFDPSLVAFSNHQLYGDGLVTFPGALGEQALTLDVVDGSGVVQPGDEAIESTEAEVERVVALVLDHARTRPQDSLGVVTLGARHANRLSDALRRALVDTEGLDDFFDEGRREPFFVKTLDRVQGDERDSVVLSVGYGKTPHGRVLHRFGLLNLEGGERRLNVALTRARRRMTVVSSLVAEDLDPARLKAPGAMMLRDFLAYAADRTLPSPASDAPAPAAPTEVAAEVAGDPLLREFADRLRGSGLVVHERFGGRFPVDLAVEDPETAGRVRVAVETDGPRYAAVPSARERDRLRAEQLRRMGWEHLRVWSTDLFRDPARDVARVHAALARGAERLMAETASPTGQVPGETSNDEGTDESALDDEAQGSAPSAEDEDFAPAPDAGARERRRRGRRAGRSVEQTSDDTDAGWGERADREAHDRWLQDQRPPHWGRD